MSETEIKKIVDDLELELRKIIIDWWNDVKKNKPEALPWFNHGIKGFVRKLWHNNSPENPDWKNYRAESITKISLAEYASIKKDLEFTLMEGAPPDFSGLINSLVTKLMTPINVAVAKIKSLAPEAPPEEAPPEEKPPTPESPKPESPPEPEEDHTGHDEPEVTPETPKSPEWSVPPTVVTGPSEKSELPPEPSKPEPEEDHTGHDEEPESKEEPKEEPPKKEFSPENNNIYKSLETFGDNKDISSKNHLVDEFAKIGIVAKASKSGIVIEPNTSSSSEDTINALKELLKEISERSPGELEKIGLGSAHTYDVVRHDDSIKKFYDNIDFYKNLKKGNKSLFLGIKISDELFNSIYKHLERLNEKDVSESKLNNLKKMLIENKEENLNIILSRKFKPKEKKQFLINKIKK